jgi:hypothetical protein
MEPWQEKESKESKLDDLEEELAGVERAFEHGDMESEEYQSEKNRIMQEMQRVEGIPIEGERDDAHEIWLDVQKQYAEGKISEPEYQRYKKMFEDYQFDAPSLPEEDKRDLLVFGSFCAVMLGFVGLIGWLGGKE